MKTLVIFSDEYIPSCVEGFESCENGVCIVNFSDDDFSDEMLEMATEDLDGMCVEYAVLNTKVFGS